MLALHQPNPDLLLTPVGQALRHWRTSIAKARQVAAFTLLTDREIRRLSLVKPKSPEELGQVAGIRRPVVDHFGPEITKIIRGVEESGPRAP
jgi:ribonuclease D